MVGIARRFLERRADSRTAIREALNKIENGRHTNYLAKRLHILSVRKDNEGRTNNDLIRYMIAYLR